MTIQSLFSEFTKRCHIFLGAFKMYFSHAQFAKLSVLAALYMLLLAFVSYQIFAFAFFSDTGTSTNNVFAAATSFPTPSPTPVPIANTLVMNELLPLSSCSSGQTNGQYLELWNGSGATVDLQQFKLSDGTNTIAIANSNTSLTNGAFAILVKSTGVINQCLSDKNGSDVNGATTVNLGGQIDLNTGMLELLDSNNNVIDTIKWGNGQTLQPGTDQSIERAPTGKDSATGTNFNASDMVVKELYTPGFGTTLLLNEFVYDPVTIFTNEWVELFNPGSSSINLTGWSIVDSASNTKSLTGLGSVNGLGFATLDISPQILNNASQDKVILKDASSRTVDQHTYTGTNQADQSIGRGTNGQENWKTCTTPTKNTSNNGSC